MMKEGWGLESYRNRRNDNLERRYIELARGGSDATQDCSISAFWTA